MALEINKKRYRDKQWLYNEYIVKKKSSCKIAEECKVVTATILRWLNKYNIPTRSFSEANKGRRNYWLEGRKQSEEHKEKRLSKIRRENHGKWKGNDVTYTALHKWVNENKIKNGVCIDCGRKTKTCWSSKNHQYTRNLDEYEERCKSCHHKYDIKNGLRVNPTNNFRNGIYN